jgi:hypothetical protein
MLFCDVHVGVQEHSTPLFILQPFATCLKTHQNIEQHTLQRIPYIRLITKKQSKPPNRSGWTPVLYTCHYVHVHGHVTTALEHV